MANLIVKTNSIYCYKINQCKIKRTLEHKKEKNEEDKNKNNTKWNSKKEGERKKEL